MRVIDGDEFNPRFHERRNEGEIAREPIQLGDNQPRLMLFTRCQRRRELRLNMSPHQGKIIAYFIRHTRHAAVRLSSP